MLNKKSNPLIWLLASIFLALLFSIMPLPSWAVIFRPHWVFIVISYWLLVKPDYLGLGRICLLGLLADVLTGATLGKQAFALTVISYFLFKFHARLRFFSFWQQWLTIIVISLLYSTLLCIEQGFIGQLAPKILFWLPLLATIVFWPLVYGILQHYSRCYRAYR